MKEYCVFCKRNKEHRSWRFTDAGWICGQHFKSKKVVPYRKVCDYDPVEVFGPVAEGYKKEWFKDVKLHELD